MEVRLLRGMFENGRSKIQELDLSHVGGLGLRAIEEIAWIVRLRTDLKVLRLGNNPGGREAYVALEESLRGNSVLEVLDVSSNRLGYDVLQRLKTAGVRKRHGGCCGNVAVLGHGNNVVEETLNVLTHGLGLIVAVFGVTALLWHATASLRLWWSCVIYCISLLSVYVSSTVFHASFDSSLEKYEFLKMCDHSAIYLLIAGSCTPFIHVALVDSWKALVVAGFQWCAAFIGIAFGVYALYHKVTHRLKIEMFINFSQGFAVWFVYPEMSAVLGEDIMRMLVASGACYVGGSLFFIAEHTVHPVAHAIWHVFVVAGTLFHYYAVLQYVLTLEETGKSAGDTLSQAVCRLVSTDIPILTKAIKETLIDVS